ADTAEALDPGQPAVWPELNRQPGNLCFEWEVGDGDAVQRATAAARHRISLTLVNNRVVVNSMETRGAIGEYDPGEDAYTLWRLTTSCVLPGYRSRSSPIWAPICRTLRRRSRPFRVRSCIAGFTLFRRSMSSRRASSPIPYRSMPIAAPGGRKLPMRWSG